MKSVKSRRVVLPAFALVLAILGTASLMLVTTFRSLERDRARMERELQTQGLIIIRTLESGARTGMMMRWGREQIATLVEEASRLKEIVYLGIFDEKGEPVALAGAVDTDPPWPGNRTISRILERKEPVFARRTVGGQEVFEVSQKFVPRHSLRPGARRLRPMMGRLHPEVDGEDWAIVLGLHRGPWERILEEGKRQTLLSFLVIVIAGSIALYLGIILQNFLVVRRTLGEMETYAESILENMADGLLSVDGHGALATYNPEALRILGREGEKLRGKTLGAVLPEAEAPLAEALAGTKDRVEAEVTIGAGGEERPVGLAVSPLGGAGKGGGGAVLLLRDLTDVRRLERKFRESEKLAAVGQMAATVAHEIRNPLSSLKGFAQLFGEKFQAGSREAGYAGLMVKEVERLNRTISDLLFFSRPMELQKSPLKIDGLLRETAGLLAPDLKGSHQIIDLAGLQNVTLAADEDQLRRVFLNIMLNAHQAAGEGGRIAVAAAPLEGGGCRIEIADSGPGLEEAAAARAFEPFFTTRTQGSGLGLAIVKKIVDLHGGSVSIAGAPEGTVVKLTLPG